MQISQCASARDPLSLAVYKQFYCMALDTGGMEPGKGVTLCYTVGNQCPLAVWAGWLVARHCLGRAASKP